MRRISLGLSVAVLLLAALPLGCTQSPSSTVKGTGGSGGGKTGGSGGSSSATGGVGGSSASGGSGGSSSATGGMAGSGGSSGSSAGGDSGGGGSSGATGGSAGTPSSGGTSGTGGGGGDTSTGGDTSSGSGGGGGTSTGAGGETGTGGGGGSTDDAEGDDLGGAGGNTAGDAGEDTGSDVIAPTCTDEAQNGAETDIDCGGGTCPKCGAGGKCQAGSDCRSGTCASDKCSDPFAATATVAQVNPGSNIWRITLGTTLLEVDQAVAAKIVTFSLDGTNMLVINNASTGSVYWTAPQSDWNWPPPAEMDSSAYTPSSQNNVLTMTGPKGTDGFQITKRFWGNVDNQTVTIEYTFSNGSSAAVMKAPWEITRVYPGGLSFFPNAEDPVQLKGTSGSFLAVPFTVGAGAAWFKYQASQFTQDIKGGADGLEGWAAHINCGAGLEQACASGAKSLILIKEWSDSTSAAPDEKEVEIYANAGHNYVEFEQQGDYQSVAAGGTMVWTMHWMLRYLPSTVAPTPESADLMTWVRGQLL